MKLETFKNVYFYAMRWRSWTTYRLSTGYQYYHQRSQCVYVQEKPEKHSCRVADAVHTTSHREEKCTSLKECQFP